MRAKLDNISSFIMEQKTFQQQRQALEKTLKLKSQKFFKRVNWFIFLLHQQFHYKPMTKKCHEDFVGPLVIN